MNGREIINPLRSETFIAIPMNSVNDVYMGFWAGISSNPAAGNIKVVRICWWKIKQIIVAKNKKTEIFISLDFSSDRCSINVDLFLFKWNSKYQEF